MVKQIIKDFDRNSIICAIVTSIILCFYRFDIFIIYIIGLILFIIISYKWKLISFRFVNNTLKNLTLTAVAIFVITILGEIWLHLYPHWLTGSRNADIVGEFSDYTSRGYLTEEVFQKRPDVVRILGLGDSFAVNLMNKGKNYHNLLEKKYLAQGKGTVEVVSAGMECTGPGYYWHILHKFGDLFKPDLVLVGFFAGNDFGQARFDVTIGDFISEPKNFTEKFIQYYDFTHWRLYKLIDNKYTYYEEIRNKLRETKTLPPNQVGSFSDDTFLELERKRSWIFDKKKRMGLQQDWHDCTIKILKIKEWCEQRQIKLVIAIFPDQFQIDTELRERVLAKYHHILKENVDLSYPHELIVDFCRTHDIYCLDLLGPFLAEGQTRQLYATKDSHWNEAGNRLAAEKIFAYLEAHNLVPARPRP